jgi:hypothetical protein
MYQQSRRIEVVDSRLLQCGDRDALDGRDHASLGSSSTYGDDNSPRLKRDSESEGALGQGDGPSGWGS